MRHYKHVNQKTFEQVKQLQAAGLNKIAVIRKVIGYSHGTASILCRVNSLQEYKDQVRKYYLAQQTKKQVASATPPVTNSVQPEESTKRQRIATLMEQLMKEVFSK